MLMRMVMVLMMMLLMKVVVMMVVVMMRMMIVVPMTLRFPVLGVEGHLLTCPQMQIGLTKHLCVCNL